MEDFSEARGWEPAVADPAIEPGGRHADDPLGDEAAFPSTWQQLASSEAVRD